MLGASFPQALKFLVALEVLHLVLQWGIWRLDFGKIHAALREELPKAEARRSKMLGLIG